MATASPSLLVAVNANPQNLYQITYPLADIEQISIANVSKATTCVVTTNSTLPPLFLDGDKVLVTGVDGMTQLATSGVDNSRVFYANVISSNTFGLYTDAALTANVDSSSFSNAVANTGGVSFFTVPEYSTLDNAIIVQFPTTTTTIGTDITIDSDTGIISLVGGKTYEIETRAFPTPNSKEPINMAIATYVDGSLDSAISFITPLGDITVSYYTPSTDTDIAIAVVSATDSKSFLHYPSQIEKASIAIKVIDGFTVA